MSNEVLTPLQERVLADLYADTWMREHFYLTGGTALAAYYLHHRRSDDLDLFTTEPTLDGVEQLVRRAGTAAGWNARQVNKRPQFLRYEVNGELQLDFVADVAFRVHPPRPIGDLRIDSLDDIAVNKVCAILGRLDPKDYVDLYFILTDHPFDILHLLRLGAQKDAGLEPFIWASLVGTAKLAILPNMIRPLTLDELSAFYGRLRDQVLRNIRPPG